MGTTINGVYTGGRKARQERALARLKNRVKTTEPALKLAANSTYGAPGKEIKPDPEILEQQKKKLEKNKAEIQILEDKLSGKKKEVKPQQGIVVAAPKDRWFIDIHQIHMSMTKRSDRRKNKGKSRKKMKKVRSKSFVKSVVLQPGMLEAYRAGRMGISPRTHSFSMRKEEPEFFT